MSRIPSFLAAVVAAAVPVACAGVDVGAAVRLHAGELSEHELEEAAAELLDR